MIDSKLLKEILNYDKETGIFIFNKNPLKGIKANGLIGAINKNGYHIISVKGKNYLAHRLAWVYEYGSIDELKLIDHMNGVRSDNRISNLRLVTPHENNKNKKVYKKSKTGVAGVQFNKKRNKYIARITVNKKEFVIGEFDYLCDAALARKEAEIKYEFHGNHGRL